MIFIMNNIESSKFILIININYLLILIIKINNILNKKN